MVRMRGKPTVQTSFVSLIDIEALIAPDHPIRRIKALVDALAEIKHPIPLAPLNTAMSPATAMGDWLSTRQAPAGFSIDRDLELKNAGEDKSVVRYARHSLDLDEIGQHIQEGKLPVVPFPLKQVYRNEWSMLTDKEDAAEAVSILIDHGYMAEIAESGKADKGRPREPRYVINPEVLK